MSNLLIEQTLLTENISAMSSAGEKNWYIEGVFVQSDVVVKNKRIYPKPVMNESVGRYIQEYVVPKRAIGELEHPQNLVVNLHNAAILIESLSPQGNDWIGKARVLNTPSGRILQGLMEGGVKLGVSTRGSGSTKPNTQGIPVVQNDYVMVAIDSVFNPSAPKAFVENLMENSDNVWDVGIADIAFLESIKEEVSRANSKVLAEAQIKAFTKFLNHIKN